MKAKYIYSHLNGEEFLKVHNPEILEEILSVINDINAEECKTKISKEKNRKGTLLYSPEDLNKKFKEKLNALGWIEDRYTYYVCHDPEITKNIVNLPSDEQKKIISSNGLEPLKSFNQTDFVKDKTAIEVQFGKYSFVAFDIFVKHMGFFSANKINVGIEILPTKKLLMEMSSGPSYYEREIQHIIRQGRGNPAVPLVIIGIEQD